jgi:hypothetical protein
MTMSIPEPPREPRWLPCLARRWVIGFLGCLLIALALCLWMALPTDLVVGTMLGPGLVLLGFWFRSVLRLRVMLREGSLVQAEILEARRVLGLNPPHLRLRYRLRGDAGHVHEHTQFVRVGSTLGKRLLDQPATVAVIHDRNDQAFSRAVDAEDFVRP